MKHFFKLTFITLFALSITSCNNDDDSSEPVNEEEVISTVIAIFSNGNSTVTLTSRDLDGDGPNDPVTEISGPFVANTTYAGTVQFWNELEDPAEDITEEVEEEALEHQVFYSVTNNIGNFSYGDMDSEGNPIGLVYSFTTNDAGNGAMTITLRHEPNKDGEGVSDGNIANAGGETDIQVTFNVSVE